ncbi:MAG: C-GCAxxG-C-C family protein [Candidatus Thiodiazotropha lotti]|uniref:C_GCAxxG_C_C family protein n=1 Tax=Candidatus Thiodiazotropha endoloripes TaxID=1818881 RepID=A0A1E2UU15_9GAMM|nr:C-GCAxxG-C-C family protein [Candidatus Thiodiazotropha endoloripes]MCG7897107.1 C-GCAxxG-C-C family protein [Candidatus Thiodiazotropha weberae]MCG7991117.1 C-GCAxxG-C-C family protein [Candidatus Thiodiazotropha lotti]MCG7902930.1 C-GCAxxG-C-C family protein [Candidatus Thiodiazotropha weberae]MCG7914988.1 C-GCAxxG-C-C family protein [Candidatus Thiodiazotropha weberae]MCG8001327.1 C-GCAxxG-C-C family protein [Candidatus Thiodiazotropha lotti]
MSNSQRSDDELSSADTEPQLAVQRFCNGCNCAQAVITSFADRYGVDTELAMRISSGLGGGVGRMGDICGTLSGAALVLGLQMGPKTSDDVSAKEATYNATRLLQERFMARHGSNRCKELLQKDLSIPAEYQEAKSLGLFKTQCPDYVETVVTLLNRILEESEHTE